MNEEFERALLEAVEMIPGAAAPESPTVTECLNVVMRRFPSGGIEPIDWPQIPDHRYFNLRQPQQIEALASAMATWCAAGRSTNVLVVSDSFTERIIVVPIGSVASVLKIIAELPAGFVAGPQGWEWVADIRFIGSAYLGFAPQSRTGRSVR